MRIVSLVPAATEWIATFGAAGDLVGRSHACRPEHVPSLPVLTRPPAGKADTATAIGSTRSRAAVVSGDLDHLLALRPDLVVTPESGSVYAGSGESIDASLEAAGIAIHRFAPRTFKQVLDAALALGRRVGRMPQAMAWIAERERTLQGLRQRLAVTRDGRVQGRLAPAVAVVAQTDPLMLAGCWVPDLVEQAGGRPLGPISGEPSTTVGASLLGSADVIIVAPWGHSIAQTTSEVQRLSTRAEWATLPAVQQGRVMLCDGRVLLHEPGPTLYRAVEVLAAALHRQQAAVDVEAWELQPDRAEVAA